MFDEARAADVANDQAGQRARMQKVADGMSLTTSDLDKDGRVSLDEFLTGADRAACDHAADLPRVRPLS
jgi:hypothetical protein